MKITKFRSGKTRRYKPRGYKTPNFRQKHFRNVTVDSEGRVYLFDEQATPLTVDERFHFFEEVLAAEDWQRVRAFYKLPKTKRRSNKSGGVRRHEGYLIGLYPKRPINVIQEERGKEAGETSWRMPAYGKALERLFAKDLAAHCDTPQTDDELLANWPDKYADKEFNPFDSSDPNDVPF